MNNKVAEFKKDLVIDAAKKYFVTGYNGTQVDKIAKELGIGVGTIYSMFGSKEGLFLAWLFSIIDKAYEEMKLQFDAQKDPLLRCEIFVNFKLSYYEKNKSVLRDYMQNNQFFLKNSARRKENPMQKIYSLLAKAIEDLFDSRPYLKEKSPTCDYMLLAYNLDGIVNSYIEYFVAEEQTVNFATKTWEIVIMFLNIIGAQDLATGLSYVE